MKSINTRSEPVDTAFGGPSEGMNAPDPSNAEMAPASGYELQAVHHFMHADLLASLAAICLYPLWFVIPGYAIGWLTDLFAFRQRTPAFRFRAQHSSIDV